MKRIAVEAALVWAYKNQMVHVARPEGTPAEFGHSVGPRLARMSFGADPVNESMRCDFEAHHDAYIIHAAVNRLDDVRFERTHEEVEIMVARNLMAQEVRQDGEAVRYFNADELGMDDMAASARRSAVGKAVGVIRARELVFRFASIARRPDPIIKPEYAFERGKRIFTQSGRRFGYHLLRSVGDDALEVIAVRREYAVWWHLLESLKASLDGILSAHAITDEMPPLPQPIACT